MKLGSMPLDTKTGFFFLVFYVKIFPHPHGGEMIPLLVIILWEMDGEHS